MATLSLFITVKKYKKVIISINKQDDFKSVMKETIYQNDLKVTGAFRYLNITNDSWRQMPLTVNIGFFGIDQAIATLISFNVFYTLDAFGDKNDNQCKLYNDI